MLLDASLARKTNTGVAPPMAGRMCQGGALEWHVAPASLGPCPHTRGDVGKAGGFPMLVGNSQYPLSWRQEQSQRQQHPRKGRSKV